MSADIVNRIAQRIYDENVSRVKFSQILYNNSLVPLDMAYDVQAELYKIMQREDDTGPIRGHKIALTSKVIQELCGVTQPVYGSIFGKQIYYSPKTLKLSDYLRLGIEFEVAFKIKSDVPEASIPYEIETIAQYVESCMPAFEIIEDRAADYKKLDAASLLMDRCWNAGVVLGEPITDWRDLDLADLNATQHKNGQLAGEAKTGDALGHPLSGLAWIANHLLSRGQTLRKGDVVITGSSIKTEFAQAEDEYLFQIEELGNVSIKIEH